MKAAVTAFATVLVVTAGTTCTAARPQGTVRQRLTPPEVVLTGCVVQGSSPAVFILENAKKDPTSAVEKGDRYFLTPVVEGVDLRTHLNHTVRITGEIDFRVSAMPVREPVGSSTQRPGEERTLPRLNAKSLTMVSPTCSPHPGPGVTGAR